MKKTEKLKAELWKRFGSTTNPAEWDGHVYGGGKLSQRFWEYFKAVELLDLDADSVVLDIGGGSPVTGTGFFAALLATAVKRVYIIDPNIAPNAIAPENVEFVRSQASFDDLKSFLIRQPEVTHISSVSVFEHVDPHTREGMIRAINDYFRGRFFVATVEFHAKRTYFDNQLTTRTISSLFEAFTNYYLDEFCASPVWCENAFGTQKPADSGLISPAAPLEVPLWYPVAIRFLRVDSQG